MKLPNWFKIGWWVILLLFSGIIIYHRYESYNTGKATPADLFILVLFVALMLVPVFSEIEIFGIKLKREIEALKTKIDIQVGELKNILMTSQVQTVNANFHGFGLPPKDSVLPNLQEEINKIVGEQLKGYNLQLPGSIDTFKIPEGNLELFKIRYNIEVKLRNIWLGKFAEQERPVNRSRGRGTNQILRDLTEIGVINENFSYILREILSICNYATHGEQVSPDQVVFVKSNAEKIMSYLRLLDSSSEIKENDNG